MLKVTKPIIIKHNNEALEIKLPKNAKLFTKKVGKDLLIFEEGVDTPLAIYENYETLAQVDLSTLPQYAEAIVGAAVATDAVVGAAIAPVAASTIPPWAYIAGGAAVLGGGAAIAGGGSSSSTPVVTPPTSDTTAPSITSGTTATAIAENSGASQVIYTATATNTSTIAYTLKSGSDAGLTIHATTGAVTLTASPDFETKPSYSFTVVATDTAGNASEKAVTLAINNLDEIPPAIIAPSGFLFTDTGVSTTDGLSNNPAIALTLASDTATWQYSLDNGTTWADGTGSTITLSEGTYDKQNIQVKQFDAAGNSSISFMSTTAIDSMVQLEAIGNTTGADHNPQITAVGTTGEYVVTFYGVDSIGDTSIFVQKFNANGTTAGAIVQLEALDITIANDYEPQITAVGTAGEYVVTFFGADSATDFSIFVQKFNANGTVQGAMVQLEAIGVTDGQDGNPQITAVGTTGEYVVTFVGYDSAGDRSIFVQKFNANGTMQGSMVQLEAINEAYRDDNRPQITAVGIAGEYVVTFYGNDSLGDNSIFVQKFDVNGAATGAMVQLEAIGVANGIDDIPQITAVGTAGEYVVTFQGIDSGGDTSIFVQKFNANGTVQGSMVQLEAFGVTNNGDYEPQITAVGIAGEYVVTFKGTDSTGDDSVFVQKFNADGTVQGAMVQLEAIGITNDNDYASQITAVGTAGEYVVTFQGYDAPGDYSVFVQKFNANGTIQGSMVKLEGIGTTIGGDYLPQITAIGTTGEYAVTFSGHDSAGDFSIFVQKFNADGTKVIGFDPLVIDTTAPIITSSNPVTTPENVATTVAVYTASATDASLPLAYTISGADAGLFNLDATTGVVMFNASPNFEAPTDSGGDNIYNFTVTATDTAGNHSDQNVSLDITDVVESLAGQATIDLGVYGKLIAPVQVDGKWFYFWDRSGDGTSANTGSLNGGVDYTTHDVLDGLFNHNSSGVTNTTVANFDGLFGTTNDYRFATLNGVSLALPTTGTGSASEAIGHYLNDNQAYTDLAEVWDNFNTGYQTSGTPAGWQNDYYWSTTPSTSGHASVDTSVGYVGNFSSDSDDYTYVALQVL